MMSSMHSKALTLALLLGSAAAIGATVAPNAQYRPQPVQVQAVPVQAQQAPQPPQPQQSYRPTMQPVSPRISSAIERWSSLRQSDGLPFSSYASFLTSYRGWPGESAMRRTAERAIDPMTTRPGEVTSFFRMLPPLTATGHARHAFALQAEGNLTEARSAARRAWLGGYLLRSDEDRLLSLFSSSLTQQDHDQRTATLLDNGGNDSRASAQRMLDLVSAARRPLFEARIALQANAGDAGGRVAMLGSAASGDAGLIMDRANWLRRGMQGVAARALLAQPRNLVARPEDADAWYKTLLTQAEGAANDRNWLTAYQIASQVDDAYAPGTKVIDRSTGERDKYTSLTWLAGTTALHRLNRPADAATMFAKYARGGRSTQVLTKGLYWAGRAAQQAGQSAQANAYFTEAAAFPELFYGQLALERLGRTVPAPATAPVAPTDTQRAAFQTRDLVEATRVLGLMGRWDDQSLFVRTLSENVDTDVDRALAMELARSIGRQDLGVWVARNARNAGTPFYVRAGYPEVRIPAAQSHLWSLAHGIIRQESSFDRAAVSHANARGMMQLMPATARELSGKMGLSYELGKLTRDPEYNVMLGSRYFEQLLNYWGGNTALAVASYNAGMGNVGRWVRENGDPRMSGVDIVRWIEEIPFSETRGYVQRVLENAVVYDSLNPARARAPERTRLSYYLGKSGRPG